MPQFVRTVGIARILTFMTTYWNSTPRCAGCGQLDDDASSDRHWSRQRVRLCGHCADQQQRYPNDSSALPITAFLADIAALDDDDDWVPSYSRSALQKVQSGATTLPHRSLTELARFVAGFHGWRLHGDELCTPDGLIIADQLEVAAAAMDAMDWFAPDRSGIFWRVFTGGRPSETCTYPNAFALRRQIAKN